MLDLRGSLGRRFGGIGAGIFNPSLQLEVEKADAVEAEGAEANRAAEFARRYLSSQGVRGGARIVIRRAIPGHSGLGSGTQLALSVARGIAELYDLDTSTSTLAKAVGRARRSAIGTWLFDGGGFVVGRRSAVGAPSAESLASSSSWSLWRLDSQPERTTTRTALRSPPLRMARHGSSCPFGLHQSIELNGVNEEAVHAVVVRELGMK